MNTNQPVSVVIPAYNCEDTIAQTLDAITKQQYEGAIEIIVVDDGSTDQTANIIKNFPNVIYVFQPNAGPAAARNRGFKNSKYDFVFFTDSDCVPSPDWISKSMTRFVDDSVGAVGGTYGIVNDSNLLAQSIYQEIKFRHDKFLLKSCKSLGSYNLCSRRNVFDLVGGFNEGYRFASGEDNDLCYKILKAGYQLCFAADSIVKHYFPENISIYLYEQFRHGYWRVKMYLDHPSMSRGDDYTFWKDIVEPVLVLLFCAFTVMGFFQPVFLTIAFVIFAGFVILELIYAFLITKKILNAIFYGFVMYMRSYARTFGFLVGFPFFLPRKLFKKI